MHPIYHYQFKYHLLLLLVTLAVSHLFPLFPAKAANLTRAYLRLDRMTAATATGGTICTRMNTEGSTDAHVVIQFPTGFTINGTAGNWTITTTNLPTGAAAMPGVNTAEYADAGTRTVRFPITDIADDTTLYCFNFSGTNTLTTSGVGSDKAGNISVTTSGDAVIDESNYATAVITNDLVVIDATVPPTFNFALATNVQNLGILSTSTVISGSGVAVSLGTNAANGWLTWIKSLNTALNSVATSDTIDSPDSVDGNPTVLSTGVNGYVVDCDLTTDGAGSGTVTIAGEYNGLTTSAGGTVDSIFQEVATSNGTTAGDVVTLIPRVTISALTRASTDYTDTLTVVGAANF